MAPTGIPTKTDTNPSWGLLPPTLDVQKKRNGAKNPIAAPKRMPMPMPIAIRMRLPYLFQWRRRLLRIPDALSLIVRQPAFIQFLGISVIPQLRGKIGRLIHSDIVQM
jgi:hypothetical protein